MLNENLYFNQIPAHAQMAFKGQTAEKRLFPAGSEFYRWGKINTSSSQPLSPWWSSTNPLTNDDPGLAGNQEYAAKLGITLSEYERSRKAISFGWNNLDNSIRINLLEPACGFVGKCSHQLWSAEAEDKHLNNVNFIGGGYQVYLPNLTLDMVYVHPVSILI